MFTSQAHQGKTHYLRSIATLLLTLSAFGMGQIPIIIWLEGLAKKRGLDSDAFEKMLETGGYDAVGLSANIALVSLLFPFALALLVLLLSVRYIHKRPMLSVMTARTQLDLRRIGVGALIWFTLALPMAFLLYKQGLVTYQFSLTSFLPQLGIVLLLLPLQVAAEEVLFRGYLLQTISGVFRRPLWPMLMITILFAAMHLANPEVKSGGVVIILVYLLISLLLGVLTVLDDGLELPIGVHLGNNLFTALILSTSDGAMNTNSIYKTNPEQVLGILPAMLLILITLTLTLLHLRYRFDWGKLWKPRIYTLD